MDQIVPYSVFCCYNKISDTTYFIKNESLLGSPFWRLLSPRTQHWHLLGFCWGLSCCSLPSGTHHMVKHCSCARRVGLYNKSPHTQTHSLIYEWINGLWLSHLSKVYPHNPGTLRSKFPTEDSWGTYSSHGRWAWKEKMLLSYSDTLV